MSSGTPMRVNKAVLVAMFVALVAMFAWSFIYRANNPSLVVAVQKGGAEGRGPMDSMGGPAMKAVVDAMAKLKKDPEDPAALKEAAEAFGAAELWDKSGQLAEKALSKLPNDTELLNLYGVVQFRQEHPAESAKTFERLLSLEPGNVHAQFNLGAVYKHGLNDQANAKKYFEMVIANPKADAETREQARQELAK